MAVIRPFALPDGRLVVQLISLGPGLCAGDTLEIEIAAGEGARVIVTTTSAARVMSMGESEHAEQHVRLHADANALLEYYPRVTIPFPASALRQTIDVTAAPTARVGVVECWAMGRAARSEYLEFRSLSGRTSLSVDGVSIYTDAMHLEPGSADVANAGVLAGRRYVAAGFWYGASLPAEPANVADAPDILAAFAQSTPDLAYLRALGDDGPALDRLVRRSVEWVARAWQVDALDLERFHG